ncbi:bacteriorhodopsin [Halobaculum marinum]|uniref:Bacteriorhodopsin n=1 Tax=Halobaculum marinum TaxID=3031996 RepID=A0ABD5WZH9_9EURY|nr:bacteriorhodopsin [Halobaculum sp. DT55]
MIADSTMYFGAALAYAAVFAVLLVRLRSLEGPARRIGGAATAIIGVSTVAYVLMGLGVTVEFAGGTLDLPNLVDDVIAYAGVYAITAALAGASVRLIGAAAIIVTIQRVAFELPYAGYVGETGALAAAAVVIVGWFVVAALFVRPIWRAAESMAADRRLLHWKCRNLVLFLMAMLIVYAVCALFGVLGEFVNTSVNLYIDLLMRVGIAGLLFVNADAIGAVASNEVERRSHLLTPADD